MDKHRILTKKQFENIYKMKIIKLYHKSTVLKILNSGIIESNKNIFATEFDRYLKNKLFYISIINN